MELTDLPLRSILISDFRRLEGHRIVPLDAPIVLLYGPNGTGKTSILSALELALTGDIRSMHRQDPRYTAHLPYHGQRFATLRVEVSDALGGNRQPTTMTVGGSRIEGAPAFDAETAQFYAERCYLDQVSLGQLLELYQYREGKAESALARFVNELLGLEQLDALHSGLASATDIRNLRKLSEGLSKAEANADAADRAMTEATTQLDAERTTLAQNRERVTGALTALGMALPELDHEELYSQAIALLNASQPEADFSAALDLDKALAVIEGRIQGLAHRPAAKRLDEAQAALTAASADYEYWELQNTGQIDEWRATAAALSVPILAPGEDESALELELDRAIRLLRRQEQLASSKSRQEQELEARRGVLRDVEARLSAAQERAGSLVEGLAALRDETATNVCPVCDRSFGEVSETHLSTHVDRKIAALTSQGIELRELREQRSVAAEQVRLGEQALAQLLDDLLPEAELAEVASRRSALVDLREQLRYLQPAINHGLNLQARVLAAELAAEEADTALRERATLQAELDQVAQALGASKRSPDQRIEEFWRELAGLASGRVANAANVRRAHADAREHLDRLRQSSSLVAVLKADVGQAAERKVKWDSRVKEAKRRQAVAKAVHDASAKARAVIVERVFTQSLNEVWRSVFTRLAPQEPFVPAFGIPTASRSALDLTLRTVHRSGDHGGTPQLMLSAGNLNTAALSLFIALHLAVDPLVPCLVFDDPVQSMDDVHVAQFAGLMRVLSKRHGRQVIIAVHERELFEYLTLELSPAFKGDQLITVELGAHTHDGEMRINRLRWSPDPAIAG